MCLYTNAPRFKREFRAKVYKDNQPFTGSIYILLPHIDIIRDYPRSIPFLNEYERFTGLRSISEKVEPTRKIIYINVRKNKVKNIRIIKTFNADYIFNL